VEDDSAVTNAHGESGVAREMGLTPAGSSI